jgi:hypothetical protein
VGFVANASIGFGLAGQWYIGGALLLTGVLAPEILSFLAFGFIGAPLDFAVVYAAINQTGS